MICAMIAAATMQLQPMVPLKTLREVQAVNSRAVCTYRGLKVVGGVTNVVETWRRGNFTWSVTNAVRDVIGKPQTNTFRQRLDELRSNAEEWRSKAEEWKGKFDAKAAVTAALANMLRTKRAAYVKIRDASVLQTTKAIYQKFIDDIDEQLAAMGETPEGT